MRQWMCEGATARHSATAPYSNSPRPGNPLQMQMITTARSSCPLPERENSADGLEGPGLFPPPHQGPLPHPPLGLSSTCFIGELHDNLALTACTQPTSCARLQHTISLPFLFITKLLFFSLFFFTLQETPRVSYRQKTSRTSGRGEVIKAFVINEI